MKNQEVWSHYKEYTRDITEFSRKLAFGGLAVCWFFKTDNANFPPLILNGLLCFVLYFLFDLLQSVSGAVLLRFWIQSEEKRIWNDTDSIEGEYLKPRWLDIPSFILLILKILFLIIAFCFIGTLLLIRS